jgi:hypothetical protein
VQDWSGQLNATSGTSGHDWNWLGDFNGDGKMDIASWVDGSSGSYVRVNLSSGAGFVTQTWSSALYGSLVGWNFLGDFNGDGKTDIGAWVEGSGGALLRMNLSTGSGFTIQDWSAQLYAVSSGATGNWVGDFNGDGKADIASWIDGSGGSSIRMNLTSPPAPDLATRITSQSTDLFTVTYKPLTDTTTYTIDTGAQAASYPNVDLQLPLYVVSSALANNAIGGIFDTGYAYGGLKKNNDGRGSLGFRWHEATAQSTGIKLRTEYRQDWPYIGLPSLVKRTQSSGTLLSEAANTYSCINPATGAACVVAAGTRYFPFLSQSVETGNDLNGAALPTVTTSSAYDSFGNATSISVSADSHNKTTTNTFSNDTANWLLGRLKSSTVTSTTP